MNGGSVASRGRGAVGPELALVSPDPYAQVVPTPQASGLGPTQFIIHYLLFTIPEGVDSEQPGAVGRHFHTQLAVKVAKLVVLPEIAHGARSA